MSPNFLILITNVCVIAEINLLYVYYCKTQRDDCYKTEAFVVMVCYAACFSWWLPTFRWQHRYHRQGSGSPRRTHPGVQGP
jgi:hypothetical protein